VRLFSLSHHASTIMGACLPTAVAYTKLIYIYPTERL